MLTGPIILAVLLILLMVIVILSLYKYQKLEVMKNSVRILRKKVKEQHKVLIIELS